MRDEKSDGYNVLLGQHGLLQDASGKTLGTVSENGFLYDHQHLLLGYVSRKGDVRDVGLHLVGKVNMLQHRFPYEAGRAAFLFFPPQKKDRF